MSTSANDAFGPEGLPEAAFREAIADSLPGGVVAVDNEGTQVFVNEAFCRMVGWPRTDLVGRRPPFCYWPQEQHAWMGEMFARMLRGDVPVEGIETLFRRRDGSCFPVLLSIAPLLRDGATTGWVANVIDMTAQVAQREELGRREQLFRDLAEHVEEVFYVMDPSEPSRILYVSPSYEKVWGRSCRSLYDDPMSFLEAVVPSARALQADAFRRQLRGEGTRSEYEIRRPDGSAAWIWDSSFPVVDDAGKLQRIVGMAADITEQKLAQIRLRRHEQQLSLAVDAARLGFWEADLRTAVVVYDRAWCDMLGVPADAPAPDWFYFRSRLHPEDAERVSEAMVAHFQSGSDRFELEFRLRHEDGRWLWILSRGLVVERDESGFPLRQIGTHQDISEHREQEASRRHGERLESIGNLTSGVAHNFNNLLGVILGTLERATMSPEATPAMRQLLGTAIRATESGAELTRSLLALARRKPPNVERVDLGRRLSELRPLLAASVPAAMRLVLDIDPQAVAAVVDRAQFDSAIVNLVVNARDAIPGRGEIRVRARRETYGPISPFVVRTGLPAGEWVVVSVTDDGAGMTEDTLRHAFDPYFTTKSASGGTGLGLPTVYAFCRSVGGIATIDSAPGRGTTVEMLLPAATGEHAREAEPQDPPQAALPPRARLLVVEDNEPLRELARDSLEASGYDVAATGSVAEALDLLEAGRFAVVFSDVMFDDGRSGLEVAEAIRAMDERPVLVLTSGVPLEGKESSVRFLAKPYRVTELLSAIEEALRAAPV